MNLQWVYWYILSLSKNENVLRKKKTNKQKEQKTAFFPLPHKCHFRTRPIPLSKIGGNAICARFLQLYRQNQYGDL